jgi:hypothetical protein
MKTTTGDKIAFACVVAVTLLTAAGWAYALTEERHAQQLRLTTYSQPTPELGAALTAGQALALVDQGSVEGRAGLTNGANTAVCDKEMIVAVKGQCKDGTRHMIWSKQ